MLPKEHLLSIPQIGPSGGINHQEALPCVLNEGVPFQPIRQILNKTENRQSTETPHAVTLIVDQLQIKSFNSPQLWVDSGS